jgi:hypothetical protein
VRGATLGKRGRTATVEEHRNQRAQVLGPLGIVFPPVRIVSADCETTQDRARAVELVGRLVERLALAESVYNRGLSHETGRRFSVTHA